MWILNITFHPDPGARDTLLEFVRKDLIPAILAHGLLSHPVLMEIHTGHAPGYALQFHIPQETDLDRFLHHSWPVHRQNIMERFGETAPFFLTKMKKLSVNNA